MKPLDFKKEMIGELDWEKFDCGTWDSEVGDTFLTSYGTRKKSTEEYVSVSLFAARSSYCGQVYVALDP